MAIEAASQYFISIKAADSGQIVGYRIGRASFLSPIKVTQHIDEATETILVLRPISQNQVTKSSRQSEIRIFARSNDRWTECCRCTVEVEVDHPDTHSTYRVHENVLEADRIIHAFQESSLCCSKSIEAADFYRFMRDQAGYSYEWPFPILEDIQWNGGDHSMANVSLFSQRSEVASSSESGKRIPLAAVMDAAAQLIFTQVSKGITEMQHTIIVQQLSDLWISAKHLVDPTLHSPGSLKLLTRLKAPQAVSGSAQAVVYALTEDNSVAFVYGHVELASVSRTQWAEVRRRQQEKKLLYGIAWKPKLSFLQHPNSKPF